MNRPKPTQRSSTVYPDVTRPQPTPSTTAVASRLSAGPTLEQNSDQHRRTQEVRDDVLQKEHSRADGRPGLGLPVVRHGLGRRQRRGRRPARGRRDQREGGDSQAQLVAGDQAGKRSSKLADKASRKSSKFTDKASKKSAKLADKASSRVNSAADEAWARANAAANALAGRKPGLPWGLIIGAGLLGAALGWAAATTARAALERQAENEELELAETAVVVTPSYDDVTTAEARPAAGRSPLPPGGSTLCRMDRSRVLRHRRPSCAPGSSSITRARRNCSSGTGRSTPASRASRTPRRSSRRCASAGSTASAGGSTTTATRCASRRAARAACGAR